MFTLCTTLTCVALTAMAALASPQESVRAEKTPERVSQAEANAAENTAETDPLASFTLTQLNQDETPKLDLGEVIRETTVPVRFEVVNDTRTGVSVTTARSACVCTQIEAWPLKLGAGESGEVVGEFHAPKRAGVTRSSVVSLLRGGALVGAVDVSARVVEPIKSTVTREDGVIRVELEARDGQAFKVLGIEPASLAYENASGEAHAINTIEIKAEDWNAAGSPKRAAFLIDRVDQPHALVSLYTLKNSDAHHLSKAASRQHKLEKIHANRQP